ncbi:MAG TPA: ABC transporter substrate-binding protein, partial [Candidatus Cloacimonadota bacterium]|nr:ABC transporter substrate-binding protein [Candidatus Cloacimonadota bacterium]
GYDFCIAEPAKAADILVKNVPELDYEQVKQSMDYLAKEYQADATYWGFQDRGVWSNFADWMGDEKLIENPIIIEKAFTNKYLGAE